MNKLLMALRRGTIVAALGGEHPNKACGELLVQFRLHEDDSGKYDLDASGPGDRIPGARLDRSKAKGGYDGWWADWKAEMDRAHEAVCKHLNITGLHVFILQGSGQLELVVQAGGAGGDQVKWVNGIEWFI